MATGLLLLLLSLLINESWMTRVAACRETHRQQIAISVRNGHLQAL
jgi:hypothetical protein